jgi:hypothetical protein
LLYSYLAYLVRTVYYYGELFKLLDAYLISRALYSMLFYDDFSIETMTSDDEMNSKGYGRIRSLPNRDTSKNFLRRTGKNPEKPQTGQPVSQPKFEQSIFRIQSYSSLFYANLVSYFEIRYVMEFGGFTRSVKHKQFSTYSYKFMEEGVEFLSPKIVRLCPTQMSIHFLHFITQSHIEHI